MSKDLLLEIGTEEIPARFMTGILNQIETIAKNKFAELRIAFDEVQAYGTPRRIALIVKNEIVSILLVGACMLAAVIILYRNLALLTSITTDDLKIGVLRITTIFNILVLAIGIIFAILVAFDIFTFSENGEKMFAMALVSCVMIFAGIISPKLPYSRHTGLRLPWTICDEDTWNIAHSILGYISLPIALLYITCALTISNFEIVTICAMAAWVGIPGVVSYLFSKKKMSGK